MDFRYLVLPLLFSLTLGWRGLVLNILFAAGTAALIGFYRKRVNGVTGDLLGAMTEILEALLFLAVCLGGTP